MRNTHRFVQIFVVASMLLLPSMLLADVTGSVLGVVRDPSQAVVKGVHVRITNTQTNPKVTAMTTKTLTDRTLICRVLRR